MLLVLPAPTTRARIVDSLQNTLKVSINSERRLQLLCLVGEFDGGVDWEGRFLPAVHVELILMSVEQVVSNESVQTETEEEVCMFTTGNG